MQYGAHEVMELHEVLTDTIDGINQFNLYRPHVRDQQLRSILDRQINFMTQEYDKIVHAVNQKGINQAVPYQGIKGTSPAYGLRNPQPNTIDNQFDDRDVASGMLGCHKSTALLRRIASLECADPELRRLIQQGSDNSAELAYEVWQYMNQKGYYQVPTMPDSTTRNVVTSYKPTSFQKAFS